MAERTIESDVNIFVAAYYNVFTYDSTNITRFYSNEAQIWRKGCEDRKGVLLSEGKVQIAPEIATGTQCSVLDYHFCGIPDGFVVTVEGTMTFEGKVSVFHQVFTVADENHRMAILTDQLQIKSADVICQPSEELVEVKSNKRTSAAPNARAQRTSDTKKPDSRFTYVNPNLNK